MSNLSIELSWDALFKLPITVQLKICLAKLLSVLSKNTILFFVFIASLF